MAFARSLVLTVVVAIPCGWLAVEMNTAGQQRGAVEGIREVGNGAHYDWQEDANDGYLTGEQGNSLERLAGKTPYLANESVIFDRPQHLFQVANPYDQKAHDKALAEVADPKYPKEVLMALLTHHDPRVRTLAMVGLFDRDDPTVLPTLARMSSDSERTFDGYPEVFKGMVGFDRDRPTRQGADRRRLRQIYGALLHGENRHGVLRNPARKRARIQGVLGPAKSRPFWRVGSRCNWSVPARVYFIRRETA